MWRHDRQRSRAGVKAGAILMLCLTAPLLMGGCPEFQNAAADAFQTATRSILDAALDLVFDQYRTDNP